MRGICTVQFQPAYHHTVILSIDTLSKIVCGPAEYHEVIQNKIILWYCYSKSNKEQRIKNKNNHDKTKVQ